jgi:hypothetical protein
MDKTVQMFIEQTEKGVKTLQEQFAKYRKYNKTQNNSIQSFIEQAENNVQTLKEQFTKYKEKTEDKLCGVCYDLEATCKLNCVHRVCKECAERIDKCPFCRKAYIHKSIYPNIYYRVDSFVIIEDINERFERITMTQEEIIKFRYKVRSLHRYRHTERYSACLTINKLLGLHFFYSEKSTNPNNSYFSYRRNNRVNIFRELLNNYDNKTAGLIYDCINQLSSLLLI